ncbi:MAG: ribbon-helix-helix domain-containing protein [Ramlibacter sp.]
MTLTVRLPQTLEQALGEYSASNGLTKSHVVQEALADYLARTGKQKQVAPENGVSANYAAFKRLGLIGCVRGMTGESATKDVVRKRAIERLTRQR